jgi:hypothetical protein
MQLEGRRSTGAGQSHEHFSLTKHIRLYDDLRLFSAFVPERLKIAQGGVRRADETLGSL